MICNSPLQYRNTYSKFSNILKNNIPLFIFFDEGEQIIIVSSIYHRYKELLKKKYRKWFIADEFLIFQVLLNYWEVFITDSLHQYFEIL